MTTLMYREALRDAMREEMQRCPEVFVIGEDVGRYGGAYAVTRGLLQEFGPERVLDCPMSEPLIVGAAVGAAVRGARPIAEIMYVDFIGLAMDQVVNQAAKIHYMFGGQLSAPLVIRTQQGTGRGAGAQHSQSLEAWFTHIPGLRVVVPSTPSDAKGLLKTSIRDDNPVVFLEHKGLYALKGEVPDEEYTIPLGVADVKRRGEDVTIVAYSRMLHVALEAAQRLADIGISAEVVDPRTLAPLDMQTLVGSVARTRRALVLQEACLTGGFGGEIAARLNEQLFDSLLAPVHRLGLADVPVPANVRLEKELVPTADAVVEAVRALMRNATPVAA